MSLFRTKSKPAEHDAAPTETANVASPPLQNPRLLANLARLCPSTTLRKDDVLFTTQDRVDSVYVIIQGTMALVASRDQTSHVFHLSAGDAFGLLGHSQHDEMVYSATAVTKTKFLTIAPEKFDAFPATIKAELQQEVRSGLAALFTEHISHFVQLAHAHEALEAQIAQVNTRRQEAVKAAFIQREIAKIPAIPLHVHELLQQLNSQKSSVGDIKQVVEKDTALAGMILKTVNSPFYGLPRKISSIHHAIAYLGFNTIYQIIVNDALDNFDAENKLSHQVQYHSMLIAFISKQISLVATKYKNLNPTTIGLLHDVGKIVILLMKKNHPHMKEMFDLLDDAELGACLLRSWDLPEDIVDAVQHQYLPDLYPPDRLPMSNTQDVAILYISHACYELLMGKDISTHMYLLDYIASLHIPMRDLRTLQNQVVIPALTRNMQKFPKILREMLGRKLSP
jgi:HD-like signal output (HDOD) protein